MMIRLILIFPLALAGAGCARDDTRYPSLAVRPIERVGFEEPAAPPARPVTADTALDAKLAGFAEQLDTIVSGFDSDLERAGRSANRARGAAVGNEPWLTVQADFATLDVDRAALTDLIAALDDVARARAGNLKPPYPALAELRARAVAESEREDRSIAAVNALVPKA